MNYFATTGIYHDNKFLSLDCIGKTPRWRFPGGKVESGERPVETAIRELHEEVGLILTQPPRFLGTQRITIDGRDWLGYMFVAPLQHCSGIARILESTKHRSMAWLFSETLLAQGSTFEYGVTQLSRLTPIHEKMLYALAEFERSKITNEQLAARLGLSIHSWTNHLHEIRQITGLPGRSTNREYAAWYRKFRYIP